MNWNDSASIQQWIDEMRRRQLEQQQQAQQATYRYDPLASAQPGYRTPANGWQPPSITQPPRPTYQAPANGWQPPSITPPVNQPAPAPAYRPPWEDPNYNQPRHREEDRPTFRYEPPTYNPLSSAQMGTTATQAPANGWQPPSMQWRPPMPAPDYVNDRTPYDYQIEASRLRTGDPIPSWAQMQMQRAQQQQEPGLNGWRQPTGNTPAEYQAAQQLDQQRMQEQAGPQDPNRNRDFLLRPVADWWREQPAASYYNLANEQISRNEAEQAAQDDVFAGAKAGGARLWTAVQIPFKVIAEIPAPRSPDADLWDPQGKTDKATLGDLSAVTGQQLNRTLNPMNPNFVDWRKDVVRTDAKGNLVGYNWAALPGAFGAAWNQVAQQGADDLITATAIRKQIEAMPPAQRDKYNAVRWNSISGGQRMQDTLDAFQEKDKAPQMFAQAQALADAGQVEQAGQLYQQATALQNKSYTDIVDENQNVWAELMGGLFLDPINLLDAPIDAVIGASRAAVMSKFAKGTSLNDLDAAVKAGYKLLGWEQAGRPALPAVQAILGGEQRQMVDAAQRFIKPDAVTQLFKRTPDTLAQMDADWLFKSYAQLLQGVTNADDAKRIIATWIDNPRALVEGIQTSAGMQRYGLGLVGNAEVLKRTPILQVARERLLNMESLAGGAGFNPVEAAAQFDSIVYSAARKLYGLQNIVDDLPAGTVRYQANAIGNGRWTMQFLDENNKVLQETLAMPADQVRSYQKSLDAAIKASNANPVQAGLKLLTNTQRSFMSDMWLNLRPAHWIRNSAAATAATMADDLYTLDPMVNILGDLANKFVGGAPTTRMAEAAAQAMGTAPTEPHWSRKIWDKGNVYAAANEAASKIWSGATEILGNVPFGEQSYYMRAYGKGFNRYFGQAWQDVAERTLGPALERAGVDPETARTFMDTIVATGKIGSKADVAQVARKIAYGPTQPFDWKSLNIADEVLSSQGTKDLLQIIEDYKAAAANAPATGDAAAGLQGLQRAQQQVMELFGQERIRYSNILREAPPQPGVYKWHTQQAVEDAADQVDTLTEAATKAGVDPQEAADSAKALAVRLLKGEQQSWDDFLLELGNGPSSESAMNIAMDLLSRVYDLKRMARQQVDEWSKKAIAANSQVMWEAKWKNTTQIYDRMAQDMQGLFTDAVDDMRKMAAGQEIPRRYDWWEATKRYLDYDEVATMQARADSMGLGATTDVAKRALWEASIEANRAYLDSSYTVLYETFRKYPDMNALSILRQTQAMVDQEGARVASYLAPLRDAAWQGKLDWGKYFDTRNMAWNAAFDNQVIFNQAAMRAIIANGLGAETATKLKFYDEFPGEWYRLIGPAINDDSQRSMYTAVQDIYKSPMYNPKTQLLAPAYKPPMPGVDKSKGLLGRRWSPEMAAQTMTDLQAAGVVEKMANGAWRVVSPDVQSALKRATEGSRNLFLARSEETGKLQRFSKASIPAQVLNDYYRITEQFDQMVEEIAQRFQVQYPIVLRPANPTNAATAAPATTTRTVQGLLDRTNAAIEQARQLSIQAEQAAAAPAQPFSEMALWDSLSPTGAQPPLIEPPRWNAEQAMPYRDGDLLLHTKDGTVSRYQGQQGKYIVSVDNNGKTRRYLATSVKRGQRYTEAELVATGKDGMMAAGADRWLYDHGYSYRQVQEMTPEQMAATLLGDNPLLPANQPRKWKVMNQPTASSTPAQAADQVATAAPAADPNVPLTRPAGWTSTQRQPLQPGEVVNAGTDTAPQKVTIIARSKSGKTYRATDAAGNVRTYKRDALARFGDSTSQPTASSAASPLADTTEYPTAWIDPWDQEQVTTLAAQGRPALKETYAEYLSGMGYSKQQIDRMSPEELAHAIVQTSAAKNPAYEETAAAAEAAMRGGGDMEAETRTAMRAAWDHDMSAAWGLPNLDTVIKRYTKDGMVNLVSAGKRAEQLFRDTTDVELMGERMGSLADIEAWLQQYVDLAQGSQAMRDKVRASQYFKGMTGEQIIRDTYDEMIAAGMTPDEIHKLASRSRREVLHRVTQIRDAFPTGEFEGMHTYEFGVPMDPMIRNAYADLGMADYMESPEAMRKAIDAKVKETYDLIRRYWQKDKQPEVGDVALHMVRTLNDAERRVLDILPTLTQPKPNQLSEAARRQLVSQIDMQLLPAYDDTVAGASYMAEKVANSAMLNYKDRRGFDQVLGLIFPYHYFWTRGGKTWMERVIRKPSVANAFYEIQRAIDSDAANANLAARLDGTIFVTRTKDGQLRLGNPLNWLLPFSQYYPNRYEQAPVENEDAPGWANETEKWMSRIGAVTPGVYPTWDIAGAMALDYISPLPNGEKRVPAFQLRQFVPLAGIASDIRMATTGEPTSPAAGGDPWDPYRVRREAAINAQQGQIDPTVAQYAQQISINLERGQDRYANIPARFQQQAEAAYRSAATGAGQQRLLSSGVGFLAGTPAYFYPDAEQQLRQAQTDYGTAGYDPFRNPYGSAYARKQVLEQNPALPAYWSRNVPDSGPQPGQRADAELMYRDLERMVYGPMAHAVTAAIVQNPNITEKEVNAIKAPYYEKMNGIYAKYPNAAVGGGKGGPPSGANPQEQAIAYLQDMLQIAGKPAYPGKDAPPEALQAYYTAKGAWEQQRLNTVDQRLNDLVVMVDKGYANATQRAVADLVRGGYAADLVRGDELKHAGPVEQAWAQREALRQEQKAADWNAKTGAVAERMGADGAALWQAYHAADDATRQQMKDTDPRVREVIMAGYSPAQYDNAIVLFGPDAWENYYSPDRPQYPEGANDAQLQQYYAALDQWNAAHPRDAEMRLWLNGRPSWSKEASSYRPGSYDFGHDWAQAKQIFGPNIWAIEREANLAPNYGAWAKANPAAADLLAGYREWKKADMEPHGSAAWLEPIDLAALPSQRPLNASMMPNAYTGPRPVGSNRQPIGAVTWQNGYVDPTIQAPQIAAQNSTNRPQMPAQNSTGAPYTPPAQGLQTVSMETPAGSSDFGGGPPTTAAGWAARAASQRKGGRSYSASAAEWAQRKASVYNTFGNDIGAMYETYLSTPKGAQRDAYKASHPELRAVALYTWHAQEFDAAVNLFGQDAIMAWAMTPPSGTSDQAKAARSAWYDEHPDAFAVSAWLYGRPSASKDAQDEADPDAVYDFGQDFAAAKEMFGENIWDVVGGYRRSWNKQEKKLYFDRNPQLSPFFDWWYGGLNGGQSAGTGTGRTVYFRRGYGGGSGSGYSFNYRNYRMPQIYAQEMNKDLQVWTPRLEQGWRPPEFNWQWTKAGQDLAPDPLRDWRPPDAPRRTW